MAKQGEIEYLSKLGEHGLRHAVRKPFSDANCAGYLLEMGAVMSLLPTPPARLLDVGCGTGWTSLFFARRGYDVVGVDIAPSMIYHANQAKEREGLDNLMFEVRDYEEAAYADEFDCAVFYDALHHAVDEEAALRMVYRALKPGGVCVASEPGRGFGSSAKCQEKMRKYNVTEKDMPPGHVIALGKKVGFRSFRVHPHAYLVGRMAYPTNKERWFPPWVWNYNWIRNVLSVVFLAGAFLYKAPHDGIVVLVK